MSAHDWISDWLWPFVRGDMSPRDFEAWAYKAPELEDALPEELFLETISLDFADQGSVFMLRQKLAEFAGRDLELKCPCLTLPNLADVGIGTSSATRRAHPVQARPCGESGSVSRSRR